MKCVFKTSSLTGIRGVVSRSEQETVKRLSTLLLAMALVGFACGANASDYQCKPIVGNVQIKLDIQCKIVQLPFIETRFPSVVFLASLGVSGTCFTGDFSGTLNGVPITGKSVSGLTSISNPPPGYSTSLATAATVLAISQDRSNSGLYPLFLGNLYLLDTIHFTDQEGNAEEQLVITEGTGAFRGAKGSLGIVGNEFFSALAQGTLCLP